MIGKLMGWIVTLIAKLIGLVLMTLVVGVVSLAGYFYYKSGQPMPVAEAQRLALGITFQEYLRFQYTGWMQVDDKSVSDGDNRSCVLVFGFMNHAAALIFAPLEVNHYREIRGTPASAQYAKYLNGIVPPDELVYGPWWNLPEIYWWQYVNTSWFTSYRSAGTCRVRPLSPIAHLQAVIP